MDSGLAGQTFGRFFLFSLPPLAGHIQEFCLAGSYEIINSLPKFLDFLQVRKGAIKSIIPEN